MKYALAVLLTAVMAVPASGRQDIAGGLFRAEMVTIRDGRMIADLHTQYRLELPDRAPIELFARIHSEAPAGGSIGRDRFIALTASLATQALLSGLAEDLEIPAGRFLGNVTTKTVPATPDKALYVLNIDMRADGVQLELIHPTRAKERVLIKWSDLAATR